MAYTYTMSYVMSVMLPCSSLTVEPDVGHMNVAPGCMLQYIYVHKSLHAFGTCHYCPRRYGARPIKCDFSVLVEIHAASSLFKQTEDSSTCRQSCKEQLQLAGHEPVCLVPGSVDKYLPVPDCTLQQSLNTHSEGFLLCRYRYTTDTTSNFSSSCVVLALVASLLDCQPRSNSQQQTLLWFSATIDVSGST